MKSEIIAKLKQDILAMERLSLPKDSMAPNIGLEALAGAFPNAAFPLGVVHELLSDTAEDAAATTGFLSGITASLMRNNGLCLWISTRRLLFPPALKRFGVAAERVIFTDLKREQEALWVVEEVLKCPAIAVVVGEISEVDFAVSRRLQLAVEQSQVTGFIHRYRPRKVGANTFVSRWRIRPRPSVNRNGLPGIGFPCWQAELIKIRNGKPGSWQVAWAGGHFEVLQPAAAGQTIILSKAV